MTPVIRPAGSRFSDVPADLPILLFDESPSTTSLYAVGDIALSGRIKHSLGWSNLFAEVTPFLQTGDLVFGNLEVPLLDSQSDSTLFAAPTATAQLLSQTGFTILNLATNHIRDHGTMGLNSTLNALQVAGIPALGVGTDPDTARRLIRTDYAGLKIGWLGCARTLQDQPIDGAVFWEFNEAELIDEIYQARPTVDVLIVSIHIGLMYLDYPDPAHKASAERITAAGADLILMHHAHVLQGIQITEQDRVICYNLGNFLLDWNEGNVQSEVALDQQRESAIFAFGLHADGVRLHAVLPIWIDDTFTVQWADGERSQSILNRLMRISHDLEGDYSSLFIQQRSQRNTGHILNILWFHARQGNIGVLVKLLKSIRFQHFRMLFNWFTKSHA